MINAVIAIVIITTIIGKKNSLAGVGSKGANNISRKEEAWAGSRWAGQFSHRGTIEGQGRGRGPTRTLRSLSA